MKTTVIHHSADFDGIFCREIARKFLPEDTRFIGWDYGDRKIDPLALPEGIIYILDLSPECLEDTERGTVLLRDRDLIWIDHHKSAIEKFSADIPGYRIDGVAACRLAWQWFLQQERQALGMIWLLPDKLQFVDRLVEEPYAVRMAGEYDIWDKRDCNAELFQHGLRTEEVDFRRLLMTSVDDEKQQYQTATYIERLLQQGRALQYAQTRSNESVIKEIGFTFQWEGLTFLGCNASRYNSHLFTAGLSPEHDGCFGFKWTGKEWSVSLYGVPGKPHIDFSKIAVKYGGGGHKQACGFRTAQLPFLKV